MLGTAWIMPTRPRTHSPQTPEIVDIGLHGHRVRKA